MTQNRKSVSVNGPHPSKVIHIINDIYMCMCVIFAVRVTYSILSMTFFVLLLFCFVF